MIYKCSFVIYILYHQFLGVFPQAIPDNWIDPYDMSPSKDYLKYSDQKPALTLEKDGTSNLSNLYLKRIIKMLLNSVQEDFIDPNQYSGHLFFKIDADKYQFLKNFEQGDDKNLEKVDKILSEIFEKPSYEFLQKYLENTFHKCLNVLLSREGIISIVIVCYSFVLFQLFKQQFSYFKIFKFLLVNFFIFDFIFTWIHLYQKFVAENIATSMKFDTIPIECQPGKMNSLQFIAKFFTNKDKCKEYFEYKYEDIFYKVTPVLVLSEIFTRTVTYPAQKVGVAFGQLCHGIYGAFPFPLNIIILPILLIFFCSLTCIILSLVLGKTIKLNFFHLISLSFGEFGGNEDQISGKNLERILKYTEKHRNFIELIPADKTNDDRHVEQLKIVEKIEQKSIETKDSEEKTKECCETNEETDKNASGDHD